jgi:hypothetical protein
VFAGAVGALKLAMSMTQDKWKRLQSMHSDKKAPIR